MGGELETPGPGQGWTSLKECLSAVQRAVAARVGGQHSAPDLVQEAYARMLDRPAAASLVNLPGYLYRAALNIAYNGSARNSVENRVHGQLALSGDEASAALDPARICADRQALGRVMAAIDALPPRCREVFVLYRFEGLAQAEIAARLGISRNMVEKHVIRAMGACRAALLEPPRPARIRKETAHGCTRPRTAAHAGPSLTALRDGRSGTTQPALPVHAGRLQQGR
ncbi:ECF sigma factor, partial [Bordetella bronchiseptica D993]